MDYLLCIVDEGIGFVVVVPPFPSVVVSSVVVVVFGMVVVGCLVVSKREKYVTHSCVQLTSKYVSVLY